MRRNLSRGARRRARATIVSVLALGAFQVLAIVGAGSAAAAGTCTYNPTTDTISITIDAGTTSTVEVADPGGEILFDGAACGSATNANTVAIVVLGQPGAAEALVVDNNTGLEFAPAITWGIDLGTGNDTLVVLGADGVDNVVTTTDDSFTVNGGGGELNGVEFQFLVGGDGDDTLDASGVSDAVVVLLAGGDGDDTLSPGAADGDIADGQNGSDTVVEGASPNGSDLLGDSGGGAGDVDTLDYSARTGSIIVDAGANESGQDANADGDLADAGDEADIGAGDYEVFMTGSGDDILVGDGDDETFVPGDGDDDVDGGGGSDTVDYSTSTVGVTIDPAGGEATGQGTDALADVEGFVGSDFDDVLVFDGTVVSFVGGAGVDTVDASAQTDDVVINLSLAAFADVEAAIGGSGNDTITGNALSNTLVGGDGNDTINGGLGNDVIEGGLGNDTLDGQEGADTVSFVNAANGVEVDNSLLFATGDGEDVFGTPFEIIVGSQFDDQILTGQTAADANQRVKGKGGNDAIVGSNSSDILSGGGGNDDIRAGSGDDTLKGGSGNDRLTAGSGDDVLRGGKGTDRGNGGKGDDICKGVEKKKSC